MTDTKYMSYEARIVVGRNDYTDIRIVCVYTNRMTYLAKDFFLWKRDDMCWVNLDMFIGTARRDWMKNCLDRSD